MLSAERRRRVERGVCVCGGGLRMAVPVWEGTGAVGSESRITVRAPEEDSSFVPSLSPNQFYLASPK